MDDNEDKSNDERSASDTDTNESESEREVEGENEDEKRETTVLGEAEQLFGKACYDARKRKVPDCCWEREAYRDSGCLYSLNCYTEDAGTFHTDPELIAYLSGLAHHELNQLNKETGESLLHIAAKYNRGGLNERRCTTGREGREVGWQNGVDRDVTQWLLENPSFAQKCVVDRNGNSAIHAAISAQMPNNCKLNFGSENHGGDFGKHFVAYGALCTMLGDPRYAQTAINVPNISGLTPLALAMKHHVERQRWATSCVRFDNGQGISDVFDISISTYLGDYPSALQMLMDNAHLKLDGIFGFPRGLSVVEGIITITATGNLTTQCKEAPSPQMQVLSDYCHLDYPCYLEKLLSSNLGGISDESKVMALYISVGKHTPDIQHWSSRYGWSFNPAYCSKKGGKILRLFFRKHSKACLQIIIKRQDQLIEKAKGLPAASLDLPALRDEKHVKKRRQYIKEQWEDLAKEMDILNQESPDFFLGGIHACFVRKYHIAEDVWTRILEFAGWKLRFPSMDELPGMPPLAANATKRKRS